MYPPTERPRPSRTALLATMMLAASACVSLQPADDIDSAQQLVASRSDVAVDWLTPWQPGAASWPPPQPLGADEAARLALHNHAGLRAGVEAIAQARADYVQAHLLPNPVLSFELGLPLDGAGGNPTMASLLQPLAALWQRPAAIDAADTRLRAAVLGTSNAALELAARARLAHARLVFAERDLRLLTRSRQLAAELRALVEQRLVAGEAAVLERNRATLDWLEADRLVTAAVVRRDRAQRDLLEVCGVADAAAMPVTDDLPDAVPGWIEHLTERDVIALAETQRLDLAAVRELMSASIDEVRLAELRRIPDVSVGVGYQRNFADRSSLGPAMRLELPLFDDGRAGLARAESLSRTAAAEVERVRQGAVAEVRRAWVALRGELDDLRRLRDAVLSLALENQRVARESLAAGVVERDTAVEFERRVLAVRLAVSEVELAAAEWFLELERAVGGRLAPPQEAR